MLRRLSFLVTCLLLTITSSADAKEPLIGDVVYLDATAECRAGIYDPNCYFQSQDAALKVVRQFDRLNIKNYILPVVDAYGSDLDPYLIFYSALKTTNGGFFLQEISPWISAGSDCSAYLKNRQDKLHRLNQIAGKAFLGFSDDEPELWNYQSTHVQLKNCLQSVSEFNKKLWLTNIFPILAGASQLHSVETGKPYTLDDFGGCRMPRLANIETIYSNYAKTIFTSMKPDIGSFDLYPFNRLSRPCKGAAKKFLQSNLKILKQQQMLLHFRPATYLQASLSIYADVATPGQIAMSRKLAESYGITTFLYFVSHSTDRNAKLVIKGMLDENNEPTEIFWNHLKAREPTHQ